MRLTAIAPRIAGVVVKRRRAAQQSQRHLEVNGVEVQGRASGEWKAWKQEQQGFSLQQRMAWRACPIECILVY